MKTSYPWLCWISLVLGLWIKAGAQSGDPSQPNPSGIQVSIISPIDGQAFEPGVPIPIQVTWLSGRGGFPRLEFLAGDTLIRGAGATIDVVLPPFTLVRREFLWQNAPVGKHILTVRALDGTAGGTVSSPVAISVGTVVPATLTFDAPAEGAAFSTPGVVPMMLTAVDPGGEIRRVEFFAGEHPLGVSEIQTRDSILPGRPRRHTFTWTNPPPGEQVLWARAKDAARREVVSAPRKILVRVDVGVPEPLVTIHPGKSPAWEAGDLSTRRGSFEVRRTGGDLSLPLSVYFQLGGSATIGADYELLDPAIWRPDSASPSSHRGNLVIPGGHSATLFAFEARTDAVSEGTETVVARLVESPVANPGDSFRHASYVVGSPAEATVEIRESEPVGPSLVIAAPSSGDHFGLGDKITIDAVGQDSKLLVSTVEFLANGEKIGEGCFLCVVDGVFPPGTPLHNRLDWIPPKLGKYVLTALGQFGPDRRIEAAPVTIEVGAGHLKPALAIVQPLAGAVVNPQELVRVVAQGSGRFGGITDVELLLDEVRIAESHVNFFRPPEADETVEHNFEVRIPAGERVLKVRDLADATVVSAGVGIQSVVPHEMATLTWVSPSEGAGFAHGSPIDLEVQARDPRGLLSHVDFWADELKIGGSDFSCPECRLIPGATLTHRMEWRGASIGRHTLHAVARDAAGQVVSSRRIEVEVTGPLPPRLSAVRTLPGQFQPGQKFTVQIDVKVSPTVLNYVVEEVPPFAQIGGAQPPPDQPRWTVSAVSDDGVFEATRGTVKFGPFFDHEPRTLTYEITPNEAVVEAAEFTGRLVADGVASETGGDQILRGVSRHPADRDPADEAITATELTAYGAAWKSGREWMEGPNPVPVEYVTRAAFLWRQGERYRFDSTVQVAPLWWVSDPFLPPAPPPEGGAVDGENEPRFHGIALRSLGSAKGSPLHVAIRVYPVPGTTAYAVEERVTETPVEVTGNGTFDPVGKAIRWGPFLDRTPRTLTYRFEAGSAGHPDSGIASFDGSTAPVQMTAPPAADGPRLVCVEALPEGGRQIVLEDEALLTGAEYELEVSPDLHQWKRVGAFSKVHTSGFVRDDTSSTGGALFYRAIRVK